MWKVKKETKYKNKKVTVDGIVFDSRKEAARWFELNLLQSGGVIFGLQVKPVFVLVAGIKYIADFSYIENGKNVAEDVKGVRTQVFNLKKRLFNHFYPDWTLRLI